MIYYPGQDEPQWMNPVYRPSRDRYRRKVSPVPLAKPNQTSKYDLMAYQNRDRESEILDNFLQTRYDNRNAKKDWYTPESQYNQFIDYSEDAESDYEATPKVDYLEKAENMMHQALQIRSKADRLRMRRTLQALQSNYQNPQLDVNFSGQLRRMQGGGGNFGAFKRAISGQESGGNYGAVNPSSGAMGKYQIIPSNIAGPGGWDREALGRNISTSQFLSSPSLQEQIATYKLKQYYNKYGVRGAASAWYSGDPNKWRDSSPQGGYPSIAAYVRQIIQRMRR